MRILQYNIWDGCHEPERYAQLQAFLMHESYDIIGFNELTDWTADMFAEKMTAMGYAYHYFFAMATSNYPIGIVSKYPIETIMTNEDAPFHHGMMHVKTGGIHFVIAHLSPFSSERKEAETTAIANYIRDIKAPLMVMGDLNALSPLDQVYYEQNRLLEKLKPSKNAWACHTKDGALAYEAIQILYDADLHDLNKANTLAHTMPTHVHTDYETRRYHRLDYMLANEALLKYQPQSHVVRNDLTDYISDHYPVASVLKG